MLNDTSLMEC